MTYNEPMTERQKIAHAYRRFGFGATLAELDAGEKRGLAATLDLLLDYEKVDEQFPISPWTACFETPNPDQVYLEAPRFMGWWALRMVLSQRPLQEKLTLFWHDHFAISAAKVELGPMMLRYIATLRTHANGSFPVLLEAVSKEPAMLRWLDGDTSVKGAPNENFAREVMELFTLGIGKYSEMDVHEAARAFTGWAWVPRIQFDKPLPPQVRALVARGEEMTVFAVMPELQDTGPKTILGQTRAFTGEETLAMLAARPETAHHITDKLWAFFAGVPAPAGVIESLARKFTDSGGNIRGVVRAIADTPAFWSDACLRHAVKSPADYTIALFRQLEVAPLLLGLFDRKSEPTKPLRDELRGVGGGAGGAMFQQGMLLLYPPDVAGWKWGADWINSNTMLERIKLAALVFGSADDPKPTSSFLAQRLLARGRGGSPENLVDGILAQFDAEVPTATREALIAECARQGGPGALADPKSASQMLGSVLRLLFAAPEFHFC